MSDFTAKDISTIIRACRDSGVKEFSLGDIKLSFHSAVSASPEIAPDLIDTGLSQEVQTKIESEFDSDEDLREIALQDLMISDPEAYEKAMRFYSERPGSTEHDVPRV